jgi:hypothetical protein
MASGASAQTANVSFLRIIRTTQAPYQPLAFRVWVKAPVNHEIFVAIKIFDSAGHTVYTANKNSPLEANYTQPYYSTSLTLKWNKAADDGSRLPRGQRFIAVAFASDFDTNQRLFRSSPYYFTLTS